MHHRTTFEILLDKKHFFWPQKSLSYISVPGRQVTFFLGQVGKQWGPSLPSQQHSPGIS